MATLEGALGSIGLSVNWITNLSFTNIIFWIVIAIVVGAIGYLAWRYKKVQKERIADLMIISDRNGVRKRRREYILRKTYPSGSKYLLTENSKIVVDKFPKEYIIAGRGMDLWIGYEDNNGFIHPVNFESSKVYWKNNEDGTATIKEDPCFTTVSRELAEFYKRSTEERVEKNRVLTLMDRMQPALIMTACIFGSIIFIVAITVGG